jgi:hypothetical protein
MAPGRVPPLVGKLEVEGDEHPPFGQGSARHGVVVPASEALVNNGHDVVPTRGEDSLGSGGEVLVELERHRRAGARG